MLAHDPAASARVLRFRARLDGDQVVRPAQLQPPTHGSGSAARGEMTLDVDNVSGQFDLELSVEGIASSALDASHGPNATAIHLHVGGADELGPVILDVHHFARVASPETDGIEPTPDGFRLVVPQGTFGRNQGALDTGFELEDLIDALRGGRSFVAVHTTTNELFRSGEIRGNLALLPEWLRFEVEVDEGQVVRPPEFQPPTHGTGSDASGAAALKINTVTGYFEIELDVNGIAPAQLDSSHGPNLTAVHLHEGGPDERGPVVLDVHHLARELRPLSNGVEATDGGFRLRAYGQLPAAGDIGTGRTLAQLVDTLIDGRVFLAVRSTKNELFRTGELRGNFLAPVPTEYELRIALDESQVVRPPQFQPPARGTGSGATGELALAIDTVSGRLRFELDVDGIAPAALDSSHGANGSAVHLHWGSPATTGPILLDIHHYARPTAPQTDGAIFTESGFRMEGDGFLTRVQGRQDTQFSFEQAMSSIRGGSVYVTVHTTTNDLFRSGEIRGNAPVASERVRVRASLDGAQVVRPPQFRPPLHGTASTSTGEAVLEVDTGTGQFTFSLVVDGITVEELDSTHGVNATAIHIHKGDPYSLGPMILDVHQYSRWNLGLDGTESGLVLETLGTISQSQGRLDTGYSTHEIIDFLRGANAYIAVHSIDNPLFQAGEIRGNFRLAPLDMVGPFIRGDCDADGDVTGVVSDAIFLLNYNFTAGAAPTCRAACDANSDGRVEGQVTDAIFLLNFNFLSGPAPAAPFPDCGTATVSDDGLDCKRPVAACR